MKRILLIDDTGEMFFVLKPFLEKQGFHVLTSSYNHDTIDSLGRYQPDLLVHDVRSDGYDGKAFCRQLKSTTAFAHIPVILISEDADASRDYSLFGASAFLHKPFGLFLLLSLVNSLLPAEDDFQQIHRTA